MFKANHLVACEGCFYFFIRVPKDLQQHIPSAYIKKSLKTKLKLRRRSKLCRWNIRCSNGSAFGKWYQRFNREHVTTDKGKVFHSLRHSLANNLKQSGVQEVVIAEILQHANDSVTTGRYGKRYQPKVLLEAMILLDYAVTIPEWKV